MLDNALPVMIDETFPEAENARGSGNALRL
jgi:hypothetical protein